MALTFNAETGFTVDELEDIRADVATQFKQAFKTSGSTAELDTDPETPAGQLVDSLTATITQKDSEIAWLAKQFDPRSASGIFQDALAWLYFITRKNSIYSTAEITITGRVGTVIPVSAIIQSETDESQWANTEEVTIGSDNTATAVFQCQTAGPIEAAPNTLTRIITLIAGWDTATNAEVADIGQNAESQAAFEARRAKTVALNARSSLAAIYARVGQVDNVISLYATENKTNGFVVKDGILLNPHSIFVCVTGGADLDIATAIYNSVSAGCAFTGETTVNVTDSVTGAVNAISFQRPVDTQILIKVTIYEDSELPANFETLIKNAVYNNFYGDTTETINDEAILRVKQGDDIYSTRFIPSILNSGVNSVLDLTIAFAPKNESSPEYANFIHIPINANPVLIHDNVIIEIASNEGEGD